jgi:hypothetical protein
MLHGRLSHSRFQSRRIEILQEVKLLCQQALVKEFVESPQNRIILFPKIGGLAIRVLGRESLFDLLLQEFRENLYIYMRSSIRLAY